MKKLISPLLLTCLFLVLPTLRAAEAHNHPPGMLGVALHEVMAEEVASLNLPGEYGAWVRGVGKDSPAAKAGLQMGDVIVSYNGQRVESARALQRMVLETPAGRTVELRLVREGKPALAQPTLGVGKLPTVAAASPRPPKSLGVGIENIAPAVGDYLGLEEGVGVVVRAVKENSPASDAGLQEKDILVLLNDIEITSASQMAEAIKSLPGYGAVLTVIRGTETQQVEIQF